MCGHSRSFKVIYVGIIEEPLMGYIVQYNKCGLRCEDSEDIASEKKAKISIFDHPTLISRSLSCEPPRISA